LAKEASRVVGLADLAVRKFLHALLFPPRQGSIYDLVVRHVIDRLPAGFFIELLNTGSWHGTCCLQRAVI
jgi:hypothetical protein